MFFASRLSCGYYSNGVLIFCFFTKRMNYRQQDMIAILAKRYPTILILTMINVKDRDGRGIPKNLRGTTKTHFVLLQVLPGLNRVPFEIIMQSLTLRPRQGHVDPGGLSRI